MNPSSGSHNCRPDYPFNDPVTNSQNCRPLCASNHPVITFPSVGIIMTNSAHLMYAKPSTYACPFTRFLLNGPLYKLEPSNVSASVPLDLFTSNTLCFLHQPHVLLQRPHGRGRFRYLIEVCDSDLVTIFLPPLSPLT